MVESGPQVQLVSHYPYEEDNAPLLAVLGEYEELWDVHYQCYSWSVHLSTGNRPVQTVCHKHIPGSLNVTRHAVKMWAAD